MRKRTCCWSGTWIFRKTLAREDSKTWCSLTSTFTHTHYDIRWPDSPRLDRSRPHPPQHRHTWPIHHSLRCTNIHTVRTASWYEVRGLNGNILYRVCDGRSSVWLERLLPILAIFPHLSGARPSKWGLNTIQSTGRYEIASWRSRVRCSSLDIISWNTLRLHSIVLLMTHKSWRTKPTVDFSWLRRILWHELLRY